jgi:hypothetical protein
MSEKLVEPFAAYSKRSVPTLRAWKHPKTMTVEWHGQSGEFISLVDSEAMNAELVEIWRRFEPWHYRRATMAYGAGGGVMGYVPHAAGVEAMAVVRKYFTEALERLTVSSAA